jgi:hypothetical protein
MKNAILAFAIAVGLGIAFVGYASMSLAGSSEYSSNYIESGSDNTRP